jgi:DNA-directed RNA polymerase subunit beta'
MAHYPKLIKGHTLQVSPLVVSGYGADFDGDTMSFHVPVSEDAVAQAKDKMLPSKNIRYAADFKAHYMPKNEYLHGLFMASKDKGTQTRVFRSKADAIRAYKAGEININDNIIIGT